MQTPTTLANMEVMGSIIDPSRVIDKDNDVESCTYCCYVRYTTLND